jgi:hypothetical protein
MNYFLYIVTVDSPENDLYRDMKGVGKTSMAPGVCDAPFGVFYVAPGDYIEAEARKVRTLVKHMSASWIRRKILNYWDA